MLSLPLYLILLTVGERVTAWDNEWDQRLNRECPMGQAVSYVSSQHHNGHEDRRWTVKCRAAVIFTQCYWSGFVNNFDRPMNFKCHDNFVITGMYSYHHNGHEDRRWKLKCCTSPRLETHGCQETYYVNDWDQYFYWTVPGGNYMTGMRSHHSNGKEQQRAVSCEACVSRMVVDKLVYLSKAGGQTVEVWDKRSEKMVDCIDCAQIIRQDSGWRSRTGKTTEAPAETEASMWATVKALLVHNGATLWIGTRGGFVILLELSKHQLLQVIGPHCQSIRAIGSALIETLNRKNVVLVLGRRFPQDKTHIDEESVLMVWNSDLPSEVKDLNKHCELREEITTKLREQHHD